MSGSGLLIILSSLFILAGLSLVANARFRDRDRLPMQWSLTGRVNWSAPRKIALTFTPALAALLLSVTALTLPANPAKATNLGILAVAFVATHLLHLALIARTSRQKP